MCFFYFDYIFSIFVIFWLGPKDIIPKTGFQKVKKSLPKSKIKELLDSNTNKQIQQLKKVFKRLKKAFRKTKYKNK